MPSLFEAFGLSLSPLYLVSKGLLGGSWVMQWICSRASLQISKHQVSYRKAEIRTFVSIFGFRPLCIRTDKQAIRIQINEIGES